MILNRLYELAKRDGLTDDLAFETLPVPWIIQIGDDGNYLGIVERRGFLPAKGKTAKPKPDRGNPLSVPMAHGNAANQGFAKYFADTLPRVLPVAIDDESREKAERSRATFWRQIDEAAAATDDPALLAVAKFGHALQADASLAAKVGAEFAELKPGAGDRCTFAWNPDNGKTIVERPKVRAWYTELFARVSLAKQQGGPHGLCQVTREFGPIPTTHPIKLSGIPGGLSTGVSIVSYDKAAFESYGLDGTANAGLGYAAVDGYCRALNALIRNKVPGNPRTSIRLGDVIVLFWTREPTDTSFMGIFEASAEQFEHLLESIFKGVESHAVDDVNAFYVLVLSGNAARAVVRDYLELPMPRRWKTSSAGSGNCGLPTSPSTAAESPPRAFPLWQLAAATAFDSDQVAPDTPARLLESAIAGTPLCESLLVACLRRLRAKAALASGRSGWL